MPAWYFLIVVAGASGGSSVDQMGPFANANQCATAASAVEASFMAKLWVNVQVSPCVQGIVPVLIAVKPEVKK